MAVENVRDAFLLEAIVARSLVETRPDARIVRKCGCVRDEDVSWIRDDPIEHSHVAHIGGIDGKPSFRKQAQRLDEAPIGDKDP